MIFFRANGFYFVEPLPYLDLKQQAQDHAIINPGTLRIEDTNGNILWSLQ